MIKQITNTHWQHVLLHLNVLTATNIPGTIASSH